MVRELRGTRYSHPKNSDIERFIAQKLRFLDFAQTLEFYRKLLKTKRHPDILAFLGCNDRFFLLTELLGRKDAVHPWIFNRCREVEANPDGYIDLWSRYHYKMLPLKLQVPTPLGMRNHGDLEPGDEVFGPDGLPTKVVAKTQVFTDGDCYRITFDKGFTVVAGAEHLWTVEVQSKKRMPGGGREGRKTVTVNTRELVGLVASAKNCTTKTDPMIRVCEPLQFPERPLPIDPYTLGAWLGDGTSDNGGLTCGDSAVFDRVATAYELGHDMTPNRNSQYRTIFGLSSQLNALGIRGKGNKLIPEQYQTASMPQRIALLQGLMDTDGHCDTRGTATFCNTNEALARGVFRLCAGLGLKPSIRRPVGSYKGEPYPFFQVSFQARADRFDVFGLQRKQKWAFAGVKRRSGYHRVVEVVPVSNEPCSCIQVERPDGMYLIGEQCIATHNSSTITNAGSIQEILCDPEITIAIFSVTKSIAHKFLSQIKVEFETNDKIRSLYRDVLWANPRTQAPTWSVAGGLTVKRVGNPKEATIEAHGLIDGQPTGRHFKLHIYDDVVTQDYLSEDMIEKTTVRWEMADNLATHIGARKWVCGTRYHHADTYGAMMKRGSFTPRIYPATHNGKLDGKPVFLTQENWTRIKRDQQSTVAAQMLLNPSYGHNQTFNPTWLKTYEVIPAAMNVYIMCDPSKGRGQRSDRTAIVVIGIDPGGNKYFLDGVRHRMKLSDRWSYLSKFYHKWMDHKGVQLVKVGYEIYGQQVDLEVIEEYQMRDKDFFKIEELNTPSSGPHAKNDRIERLEPDIKGGLFYFPAVVYHPDYREQSQGRAIWQPWLDEDDQRTDKSEEEGTYRVGQIIYRPLMGMTRLQRKVSLDRVVNPIRRIDEINKVYDVTCSALDEIMQHPFGHYKDLIDAMSRIYDMDPQSPQKFEVSSLQGIEDDFNPEAEAGGEFSLEDDFSPTDASHFGLN